MLRKAGGEPRCSERLRVNPGAEEGWRRTQVLRKAEGEPRCSERLGVNPGGQEGWR